MPRPTKARRQATKRWRQQRVIDEWKKSQLAKQKNRGKKKDAAKQRICRCGSREFTRSRQTFADGTVHNRLDCAKCGKYVAYESG